MISINGKDFDSSEKGLSYAEGYLDGLMRAQRIGSGQLGLDISEMRNFIDHLRSNEG